MLSSPEILSLMEEMLLSLYSISYFFESSLVGDISSSSSSREDLIFYLEVDCFDWRWSGETLGLFSNEN